MHESTPPKHIMLHERQGWANSLMRDALTCLLPLPLFLSYNTIIPQAEGIYTSLSPKQFVSVEPGGTMHTGS